MQEVRSATAAFLAAKTKNEILQAEIAYKLLCIGVSDTRDLAHSPQLAERDFYVSWAPAAGRRPCRDGGPRRPSRPWSLAGRLRRSGTHGRGACEWLGYDGQVREPLHEGRVIA